MAEAAAEEEEYTDASDRELFDGVIDGNPNPNIFDSIIFAIKHNDSNIRRLDVSDIGFDFSTEAWRRLGIYIGRNTHLRSLDFEDCGLEDDRMQVLFGGAAKNKSIKTLNLRSNHEMLPDIGLMCLAPLSGSLTSLDLSDICIRADGLAKIAELFAGGPLEELNVSKCDISNIKSLHRTPRIPTFPNLVSLDLSLNPISKGGYGFYVTKLLKSTRTKLERLHLNRMKIPDRGVEAIAESLSANTTLTELHLQGIQEGGMVTMSKLFCDVSSIHSTLNSNHIVKTFDVQSKNQAKLKNLPTKLVSFVESAITLNREADTPEAAARAKVIHCHLISENKTNYCALQSVENIDGKDLYTTSFIDMNPNILPNVASLISQNSNLSDLYQFLKFKVPFFMSLRSKEAALKEQLAKIDNEMATLVAKRSRVETELKAVQEEGNPVRTNDHAGAKYRSRIEKSDKVSGTHHNNKKKARL